MPTALIKFTQGPNTDIAGRAVIGTLTDGAVTVTNGDNTNVQSWEVLLVDAPPESSNYPSGSFPVSLGAAVSATPSASFSPDVPGTYRVMLDVVGGGVPPRDRDVRCFGVPNARGIIIPPYQKNPDPLPVPLPLTITQLTDPAAKPDEQNYGGQGRGWAGQDLNDGQLHTFFTVYKDNLAYVVGTTPASVPVADADVVLVNTTTIGAPSTLNMSASTRINQQYEILDNEGSATTNVITVNLPGGHTFPDATTSVQIATDGGSVRLQRTGATSWVVFGRVQGGVTATPPTVVDTVATWGDTLASSIKATLVVATASGSLALPTGQSLSVGASVAPTGDIRLSTTGTISVRSGTGTALNAITTQNNDVYIGSATGSGSRPTNIFIDPVTEAQIMVNGLSRLSATNATVSTAVPFGVNTGGGTLPSTGDVRLRDGATVVGRSSGGGGTDATVLSVDVDAQSLGIGDTVANGWASVVVSTLSGGTINLVPGSTALTATSSRVEVTPPLQVNNAQIRFTANTVGPVIYQLADTTDSVTGDQLSINAQDCTGLTSTGGDLWVRSGDGTQDCGRVLITSGSQAASTTRARALLYYDESVADQVFVGGTAGGVYTRPVEVYLDASSQSGLFANGNAVLRASTSTISLSTAPTMSWASTVVAPTFNQTADNANLTGDTFTIQAQSLTTATGTKTAGHLVLAAGDCSGGTSNTGGSVTIRPGQGATALGALNLADGNGTARLTISATSNLIFAPSSLVQFNIGGSSTFNLTATTASFAPAVSNPQFRQDADTTSGVTGDIFTVAAQATSAATGNNTGGALTLVGGAATTAGTGTRTGGAVNITGGAGTGSDTTGTGGAVNITGGAGSGSMAGIGGSVVITAGLGSDGNGTVNLRDGGGTTRLQVTAAGVVGLGSGNPMTVTDSLVTMQQPLAVNASAGSPAESGMIRLPYNGGTATIAHRNSGGTGDQTLVGISGGTLVIGEASPNGLSTTQVRAQNTLQCVVSGGVRLTVTSTAVTVGPSTPTLQWDAGATSPVVTQANDTANSATGDELRIGAQTCTGTTSVGGGLHLHSGDGTTDCGRVLITSGRQSVSSTQARSLLYYDEAVADVVTIGGAGPGSAYTRPTNVHLDAQATVGLVAAGATRVTVADALVTVAVPLVVNASAGAVSSVGMVRLPASATVSGKNASAADMSILAVNSSDLQVGGALAGARPSSIVLDCSSTHFIRVNGATCYTATATALTLGASAVTLQWDAGATAPVITQANDTGASATADELRIGAQTATGTTSVGGGLHAHSGDGTQDCGRVLITSGRQSVSGARARVIAYYNEATADTLWIGGTGPGGVYTRPAQIVLDCATGGQVSATMNGSLLWRTISGNLQVWVPLVDFSSGQANPTLTQATLTTGTTGQTMTVKAQSLTTATGTKTAGKLVLEGGDCSGGTSNTGGAVEIRGGNGAHNGGLVLIEGGSSDISDGGAVVILGGSGNTSGAPDEGGSITLGAGDGGGIGGSVVISAGPGDSEDGVIEAKRAGTVIARIADALHALGTGGLRLESNGAFNVQVLSGSKTLSVTGDPHFQKLDTGGSNRNVDLPAEGGADGLWFWIMNTGSDALIVRNDTPATIVTLNAGEQALVICNGTSWVAFGPFS